MITIRFSGRVPSPRTIEIGQETDSNADKLRFLLPQVGSGQAATLQMIFPDGTADAINITDGMITLPASALDQAGRIRSWVEILAADAVAWHSELFYLDVGELPVISEIVEQQYPTAFQDTMAQTTENRRKAEAWAVGQRDGADVESTDEAYQNNAKYYSQQGAASAEAAAASAAAAAESEAAAAASAENAAASEAAAAASESNAAESEAAAAASETNAAVSETAAAGSATAAAESAEDAAGSALEAEGSAEDAAASAAAADASAEAAAESAARVDMAVLDSEEEDVDLDLADRSGNVLVRMAGGHIRTKNFDSGELNAKFAAKQNTLTFDDAPAAGSGNPVKSGGVYTALAGKQDGLTFDSAPVYGSGNPVTSGGVYDAVSEANEKIQEAPKCVTADADADLDLADPSGNVLARFSGGHIKTKNFDSGELNAKFAAKQNALTFDDAPTQGSNNPVKSGGVYGAMEALEDAIGEMESDLNSLPAVKDSMETGPDLDVTDSMGNVLARFIGGHVQTKNFDSSKFKGYQYIEYMKSGTTTNQSVTVTISQHFSRGDRIVLHTDRSSYPYNAPWNPGIAVTYYEDNRPILSNARIDIGYIEHTITDDTDSISVEYDGTLSSGSQTVTLHVYRLGDIPIMPHVVTVKKDGTGDYTTLRAAVDAIGLSADDIINPYIIQVYPGTYDVLADYTDEEINAAVSSFGDMTFVGLKLLNGISLVGVGNLEDIILTASLNKTDYTADVRGGISTINKQGSGTIENVTIISENLRYCFHDDFGSQEAKRIKRTIKNCIFRAYSSAYTPDTSYGAGMPKGGMDAEYINCDFGENGALHLNSQMTSAVFIRFVNCKGLGFRIGDNVTVLNTAVSEYWFDNCSFEYIYYGMAGQTPHIRIRGSGNSPMMINAPNTVLYNMDSVVPVPVSRLNANVGDIVEWYAQNIHGPRYRPAMSVDTARGMVVFKTEKDIYIQTAGFVRTDRAGITTFSLNDYIGLNSGMAAVVQNESDAFGRIKFIDSDGNGYIELKWR